MAEDSIRIEKVKIKDLHDFAQGYLSRIKQGQFVPISIQRAVAHANNPYADEDDIALLVAFDHEDECVGYFGIMPIQLRTGDQFVKVHWFTTWNVSSKVRGQGVGTRLMEVALSLKMDYVIVGSVYARRVCRRLGFWEREPLRYYILDITGLERLNPLTLFLRLLRKIKNLLRIRGTQVRISNPFIQAVNRILSPLTKKLFYALLTPLVKPDLASVTYKEVSRIDRQPPKHQNDPEVEFHRGIEAVNWMLKYPWVAKPGESPTEGMDYYFSDVRPVFGFKALEVFSAFDETYLGFVVLSLSEVGGKRAIKTLDYRLNHPEEGRILFALALQYGAQHQVDRIELPVEAVEHIKRNWLASLLLHQKQRIYQCYPKSEDSPLALAWSDIHFRLSDGDMPFT